MGDRIRAFDASAADQQMGSRNGGRLIVFYAGTRPWVLEGVEDLLFSCVRVVVSRNLETGGGWCPGSGLVWGCERASERAEERGKAKKLSLFCSANNVTSNSQKQRGLTVCCKEPTTPPGSCEWNQRPKLMRSCERIAISRR